VLSSIGSNVCWAQAATEVRVRVLDYRTGLPVKGRLVGLESAAIGQWSVATTDKDGVATFQLSNPLPQVLTIDSEVTLANWSCTERREFQTSEVLERGIVGGFEDHQLCKVHTPTLAVAQPGEIIVYTRHLNAWLTFRRFMHEAVNG
jgi:hypothetical protein